MKDNFSSHATLYANFRPQYPKELFAYINSFVKEKKFAWDCGTGNGQTSVVLAQQYQRVFATDISHNQINEAKKINNIEYKIEPAEKCSLPDRSADLITVSQALHWFNLQSFYEEVKRVGKAEGIIAAWTYNLLQTDERTDALIRLFYVDTLHSFWDPERKWVDDGYQSIPFPFTSLPDPGFTLALQWNLQQLHGYLSSWSAVQKFIKTKNYNPVDELILAIQQHWHSHEKRKVLFPIFLKLGYIHS